MATKRRKSVRRRSVRRRRRHLGQLAPVAPQPQYIVEESGGSGMIILGLGALAILGIGAVLLLRRAPATATTTSGGAGAGAGGSASNAASLSPASLTIPAGNFNSQEVSVSQGKFDSLPAYPGLTITYADNTKTKINIARTANIIPGLKKVSITTSDFVGGARRDFLYDVTVQ